MNFLSLQFILFLALCAAGYYLLPQRARNPFLLLCSYWFYMKALPQYLIFIVFSTFVTYSAARLTARLSGRAGRWVNGLAVAANLGVLFTFKYFNFFMEAVASLAGGIGLSFAPPALSLAVPLGISFYTFQSLGYQFDVARGSIEPERNLVTYALFVSFFPQLLSGPIGRAKQLLPQYKVKHELRYENLLAGFQRFLTGVFKKAVVADWLASYVTAVYGELPEQAGNAVLLAAIFYNLQVLCDFSGYTDMAVGAARILGFELSENFAAPLLSENMSGFWKRWHMSLTSWLQDYVFTPLVWSRWFNKLFYGKKASERPPHILTNIVLVFLLSGLWHGSTLNFLIWGGLHGIFRVGEELIHKLRKRSKKLSSKWLTLARHIGKSAVVFILSAFALVFFGTANPSEAAGVLGAIGNAWATPAELVELMRGVVLGATAGSSGFADFVLVILAASFALVTVMDVMIYNYREQGPARCNPLGRMARLPRWLCYYFMLAAILLVGCFGSSSFVYFQF